MAKRKMYFYECVNQVDVGFMAPDHRKERWPPGSMQPPMMVHSLRFKPAKYGGGMGDILMVDRPLATHYTEPQTKFVRRKNLRTNEYKEVETTTKVKFALLSQEDIGDAVRKKARSLVLREEDYAEAVSV